MNPEVGTGYIVFEILKLSTPDVGLIILRIPKLCLSLKETLENSLLEEISVQSILESKTSIVPIKLILQGILLYFNRFIPSLAFEFSNIRFAQKIAVFALARLINFKYFQLY
jgi:hypothetical protein